MKKLLCWLGLHSMVFHAYLWGGDYLPHCKCRRCPKITLGLLLFLASCGYGQYQKPTVRKYDPAKIDSVKYYRYKFLEYTDSMNLTRGKRSARYEDSVERYYKLLYKQP